MSVMGAPSIQARRDWKSSPGPPLRISRNDERFAGFEEGFEAAQDLRPPFPHSLEGGAPLRKLVVSHAELAHQSHRLDLVGHARGLVFDELRLEAVHQLLSRNHLDHHAFHTRAGPPVQFGPVHVVEPAAWLELGLEFETHVVLTRKLRPRERIPKRPWRGADVDDVDQLGLEDAHRCAKFRIARSENADFHKVLLHLWNSSAVSCASADRGTSSRA